MLLTLVSASLLCACSKKEAAVVEKVDLAGYFLPEERVEGGGDILKDGNLKSVEVKTDGSDTLLVLHFTGGSRLSGSEKESNATSLPSYSLSMLSSPGRLCVAFPTLKYWDYLRSLDLSPSSLLKGAFLHKSSAEEGVCLYFHLGEDSAYQVEEAGGSMQIESSPVFVLTLLLQTGL